MLHMDKLNLEIVGSNFQVVVLVPDFGRMKIADKEIFQFALQNICSISSSSVSSAPSSTSSIYLS